MVESTNPTLFAAGLRMFWGLLVVLGILLIIYGLMRKRLSLVKNNDTSAIKIKEIRHLMPKKSLCLVEVGDQEFLLGLSSDAISLLAPVSTKKQATFDNTLESIAKKSTDES
jgi:flagellar protein FliO/FliZ